MFSCCLYHPKRGNGFGYSGYWYNQLKAGEYEQQNNGRFVDDVPHFQIEVSCKAYISEINQDLRKKLSLDVYEKFETALNEKLKLQIESAIEQAVIRDNTDIFNFDVALQQQQTEYWKVHRDSWAQELTKIKYTVNVTSSVDRVQQEASPAF
ncbi:MAG: Ger(x)C family spore germination C-terminal domain-containing protein [Acutalibacteraceae bacterium]